MGRTGLNVAWRLIRRIAEFFVLVVLRWRVEVRGLEHVPEQGGAVIAFNHHSYFDFVMAAWDIVRQRQRPVRFLAKREIWSSPWVGWIVRIAKAVPVDRESPTSRHGAFAAAVEALRAGDLVGVAPEQTISTSYELLPLRTGAVRMAQAAQVPIVPAIGFGSQRLATKGQRPRLARRIPVSVVYGEPLRVAAEEDPVEATQRLQSAMAVLLDQVIDSYPERPQPGDDAWWPAARGGGAPTHDEVLDAHRRRQQRDWDGRS